MISQSLTTLFLLVLGCLFLVLSNIVTSSEDFKTNSWDQVPVQNSDLINSINGQPGASWKAVEYPQFKGKSLAEITNLLGALNVNENDLRGEAMDKDNGTMNTPLSDSRRIVTLKDFPPNFDAREQWPQCIRSIRNQKNCGSCWAFSASSVLADRFCIKSGGKVNVDLSPQFMLACSGQNNGCNGGFFDATWRFLVSVGTVSEACVPYVSFGGLVPACNVKSCGVTGQKSPFYRAGSARKLEGMLDIMADLKANGPVQAAMGVYRDFYSYKSGVYHHISGRYVGGHAVKIVGWGYDSASKLPYWICANSWGEDWGIKGYFWILRGRGECGLGKMVWSGKPSV